MKHIHAALTLQRRKRERIAKRHARALAQLGPLAVSVGVDEAGMKAALEALGAAAVEASNSLKTALAAMLEGSKKIKAEAERVGVLLLPQPVENYCAVCFDDTIFVTEATTGKAICTACGEYLFPDEDGEDGDEE